MQSNGPQTSVCFYKLQGWVSTDDTLAQLQGTHHAPVKPLPSLVPNCHQRMAKHPTHRGVPIDDICTNYGATDFIPALSWFIAQYQHPDYSKAQVKALSEPISCPIFVTWHFHHASLPSFTVLTNPDHSRFHPLTPDPDLNIYGLRRIFCQVPHSRNVR